MEPTYRYGTRKAIDKLAEKLNLSNDLTMQDWSYEVANPYDIEKYISLYDLTVDEDEKFVLMELIIQATEDQETDELFVKYSIKIKSILKKDFSIHEYTIYYWACFDNEHIEDCWKISPLMRQLWSDKRKLSLCCKQ